MQNAEDQLSYTYLETLFDGVVVEAHVKNFGTVSANPRMLRLLDTSSIEFLNNVPEGLIALAPYLGSVSVEFDALRG